MNADLYLLIEEADALRSVVLVVEELKVDVPEVDHDEVDARLIVFPEVPDHILLILAWWLHVALTELKFLEEESGQILYFLNFGPHPNLDDHKLILADSQLLPVRVQQFKGKRDLIVLDILAPVGIEIIDLLLEVKHVNSLFS